ncbi:Tn3 transposase DDE domain-containing protein [Actinomadura madurae]|uniref:Tn3 transposase DDE domain-containing protein n=1 Tax=Actinomadura madurae TaxID=1993 RepID=A0A1I5JNJ0_9ACTN|nr:Tn3 family transposase [Actinomadura madurae]SFO74103.1 Tn3 transposase DDE domain-containing protein [Actinomadura madurae]
MELLISAVHRIKARATKRVEQAFIREIRPLRYVRRCYLSEEAARLVAAAIATATFAARQAWLWGEGSTAVAADSTQFSAFDQNIFTEWHSRYGGRGILIYWHIETGSVAVP